MKLKGDVVEGQEERNNIQHETANITGNRRKPIKNSIGRFRAIKGWNDIKIKRQ